MNNIVIQTDDNLKEMLFRSTGSADAVNLHANRGGILYKYYRDPWVFYINSYLTIPGMPSEEQLQGREHLDEETVLDLIRDMDSVFSTIKPLQHPILVFRGVRDDNIKQGQFYSTSFNIDITGGFTGNKCCILEITVPAGVKALITNNTLEEVILDRNTKLELIDSEPRVTSTGVRVLSVVARNVPKKTIETVIDEYKEKESILRKALDARAASIGIDENIQIIIDLGDLLDIDEHAEVLGVSPERLSMVIEMQLDDPEEVRRLLYE